MTDGAVLWPFDGARRVFPVVVFYVLIDIWCRFPPDLAEQLRLWGYSVQLRYAAQPAAAFDRFLSWAFLSLSAYSNIQFQVKIKVKSFRLWVFTLIFICNSTLSVEISIKKGLKEGYAMNTMDALEFKKIQEQLAELTVSVYAKKEAMALTPTLSEVE